MSKRKNQSDGSSDRPFDARSQINSPILVQTFASRPLNQSIATQRSPISSPYLLPADRNLHSWIDARSLSSNFKTSFVELPSEDSPMIKHQTSPSEQKMYSSASKSNQILSPILLSPNKVHHIWRNSPPSRSKSSSSSRVLFNGTMIEDSGSIPLTSFDHKTKHVHETSNHHTLCHNMGSTHKGNHNDHFDIDLTESPLKSISHACLKRSVRGDINCLPHVDIDLTTSPKNTMNEHKLKNISFGSVSLPSFPISGSRSTSITTESGMRTSVAKSVKHAVTSTSGISTDKADLSTQSQEKISRTSFVSSEKIVNVLSKIKTKITTEELTDLNDSEKKLVNKFKEDHNYHTKHTRTSRVKGFRNLVIGHVRLADLYCSLHQDKKCKCTKIVTVTRYQGFLYFLENEHTKHSAGCCRNQNIVMNQGKTIHNM